MTLKQASTKSIIKSSLDLLKPILSSIRFHSWKKIDSFMQKSLFGYYLRNIVLDSHHCGWRVGTFAFFTTVVGWLSIKLYVYFSCRRSARKIHCSSLFYSECHRMPLKCRCGEHESCLHSIYLKSKRIYGLNVQRNFYYLYIMLTIPQNTDEFYNFCFLFLNFEKYYGRGWRSFE